MSDFSFSKAIEGNEVFNINDSNEYEEEIEIFSNDLDMNKPEQIIDLNPIILDSQIETETQVESANDPEKENEEVKTISKKEIITIVPSPSPENNKKNKIKPLSKMPKMKTQTENENETETENKEFTFSQSNPLLVSEITDATIKKYFPIVNKINYENPEKSVCDICLNPSPEDHNEMIICDLCNSATHQLCFKEDLLVSIPKDNWFCHRCRELLNNNLRFDDIKCFLCPDLTGIMKKVDSHRWAHIDCINWTPEIWFVNNDVTDVCLKDICKERFALHCSICKNKIGSCIQCDENSCLNSFHVRCAKNKGLIIDIEEMKDVGVDGNLNVYCKMHSKFNSKEETLIMHKEKLIESIVQSNSQSMSKSEVCYISLSESDDGEDLRYLTKKHKRNENCWRINTWATNSIEKKIEFAKSLMKNTKNIFDKEKTKKNF